jgi:hypothetical protein
MDGFAENSLFIFASSMKPEKHNACENTVSEKRKK